MDDIARDNAKLMMISIRLFLLGFLIKKNNGGVNSSMIRKVGVCDSDRNVRNMAGGIVFLILGLIDNDISE